jgi:hypothetical protein
VFFPFIRKENFWKSHLCSYLLPISLSLVSTLLRFLSSTLSKQILTKLFWITKPNGKFSTSSCLDSQQLLKTVPFLSYQATTPL